LIHREFTLGRRVSAVKHAENSAGEISARSQRGAASAQGTDFVHHGVRDVCGGGVDIARP
jgi:hypothetical protein